MPPTTTTSAVADATTADPNVLAQQLQAVLDRYVALYSESRTDPNRSFTDETLIDSFRQVATEDFIGTFLILKWTEYRDSGISARRGPARGRTLVATSLAVVSASEVQAAFCDFDDGVTYRAADGTVVDDSVVLQYGTVRFLERQGLWLIDQISLSSTESVEASSQTLCGSESN
jgi:hypothetical protein